MVADSVGIHPDPDTTFKTKKWILVRLLLYRDGSRHRGEKTEYRTDHRKKNPDPDPTLGIAYIRPDPQPRLQCRSSGNYFLIKEAGALALTGTLILQ